MDPRGVGRSRPAIDCGPGGGLARAFVPPSAVDVAALLVADRGYVDRCVAANPEILAHVSTANVARDMDLLRGALGERKIAYFGQSYGTLLGATYARLFPRHCGAMVLDGPVDPDQFLNHPLDVDISAAQEDALERFLGSCPACGFGGADPRAAYDALLASLAQHPIPAHGGPVPLVIAATHDPVTPYAGAAGLIRAMGRGRLLTVVGDGHTHVPGQLGLSGRRCRDLLRAPGATGPRHALH